MGILRFAVTCIHVFAWPIFALGYPLCASIRAIETNSNYHMRKLVTYWILFSLISLFELAFVQFIEWLPLWHYIKTIFICWLVIPRFTGAYFVYKRLVQPCLSVNLQVIINWFNKQYARFLKTETFLSVAERYIKENGAEALEELIAKKSKGAKPNLDVEDISAVGKTEKKEMAAKIESKDEQLNTNVEEIKAIPHIENKDTMIELKGGKPDLDTDKIKVDSNTEKKEMAATTIEPKCKESNLIQKDIKAVEVTETSAAAEAKRVKLANATLAQTERKSGVAVEVKVMPSANAENTLPNKPSLNKVQVNLADSNLAQTDRKMDAAVEVKEMTVPSAGGENTLPNSNNVQKEWTCAVCQVRAHSEAILNSHLQGRKHRAKCEQLKQSKQAAKNKSSDPSSTNVRETEKQEKKGRVNVNSELPNKKNLKKADAKMKQHNEHLCSICNVRCPCEITMESHLNGKKHLSRVLEMANLLGNGFF